MSDAIAPETLVYLERIKTSTPAELSAWRHELERAAARGMPWTRDDDLNSPGGGSPASRRLGHRLPLT